MDNRTIIIKERIRLLGNGLLKTTGRKTTITTEEGEIEIEEPEPIYTLQEWGKKGYSVKKGEHAIAAVEIWVTKKKQKEYDDKKSKEITTTQKEFIKQKAYFFKRDQVSLNNDKEEQ